ncbi:unnamed protein product [Ceutorhynchus assimilis]|uniref:CHHC U11-48K-type domain-containing protein n=1 Tax=Ceutorhynchus assimilis TaxID=467358 RepID=A0A9N9QQ68_9CUCU|nr:unnamed protein product [Ceutorhynchus assimilis]
MEFSLEERKKQLKSLKQFIQASETSVNAVFKSVGWTIPKTSQDKPKVICPFNKHHSVSQETLQKHLDECSLNSAGYQEKELLLPELDETEYSIKLTREKKIEALTVAKAKHSDFKIVWNGRDPDPMSSDRLISTYSPDERLALYDYTIKHTKAPPKPDEFTLELPDKKEKKGQSEKDRLTNERDSKRRSVKYKSTHTSKKSQTEIMKEVIDNQMELYKDWVKQKEEQEKREKEELEKIAKEKIRKQAKQYQPIANTYDKNLKVENQWSAAYTNNYNQGVITDWSHLYQAGSDLYGNSGQYAEQSGCSQPNNSIDPMASYTDTSQFTNYYGATSSDIYGNIGKPEDYYLGENSQIAEEDQLLVGDTNYKKTKEPLHSRDRRK